MNGQVSVLSSTSRRAKCAQVDAKQPASELRQLSLLCLPTAFDLVATVLMNIGLLSVTASVYQMMRGAEMLFAALFALLFLGRALNRLHALGHPVLRGEPIPQCLRPGWALSRPATKQGRETTQAAQLQLACRGCWLRQKVNWLTGAALL